MCWYIFQQNSYFCNILWLVWLLKYPTIKDLTENWTKTSTIWCKSTYVIDLGSNFAQSYDQKIHYPSCVDLHFLHQKFNMTSNINANFVTHSLEKRLFLFVSYVKVTQINSVSRNELPSTEFLLSTFEFERQNIAGWCKQTFCIQFSSKAKHDFFSFLSGLLNEHNNSNFVKIVVEWCDSMKWNYVGFTGNDYSKYICSVGKA